VKRRRRTAQHLVQLVLLIAAVAAWFVAARPGGINPLLLPAPVPVFQAFWALLMTNGVWPDVFVTLYEWLAAFVLAAVCGCIVGYFISLSPYAVRVFDPLLAGLSTVPAILLYPLYLLFFGLGSGSKIAIATTIAFFPIVLNTIVGFSCVDRAYVKAARSMGASNVQLFRTVLLPGAFPVVLTGLRLGCIIAFLTILGAETLSALAGLGHRIVALAEDMDVPQMFANIIFAVLLAVAINAALSFIEARGRRWVP
jgi:ABC-type nitrate/sulfonate/bicarbonate transport system permease component